MGNDNGNQIKQRRSHRRVQMKGVGFNCRVIWATAGYVDEDHRSILDLAVGGAGKSWHYNESSQQGRKDGSQRLSWSAESE
jgi:hypothetical protein